MSRLITCGFEENHTGFWATAGTTITVITSPVHSGTYAVKLAHASNYCSLTRSWSYSVSEGTEWYGRVYIRFGTVPTSSVTLIFDSDGSTNVGIRYNAGSTTLDIYNGVTATADDSGFTPSVDTWYRIEFRHLMSNTVGQFEGRLFYGSNLEGATADLVWGIGNFTGGNGTDEDTFPTGGIDRFTIRGGYSTNGVIYDDIALNNTSGSFQTSWPGKGKICLLYPNGDTSVSWTKAGISPAGTNFEGVDEYPEEPPNDGDSYNEDHQATNVDQLSLTNMPAEVGSSDTIVLVHPHAKVGNDSTSGSPSMILRLWDESSSTTDSAAISTDFSGWRFPTTTEQFVYDASGKTKANIDSFSVGYKGNTADGYHKWITTLWVLVEWYAAAGGTPLSVNVNDDSW